MWILDCDGDLFQHKKLWLMPGSTHLIGRTSTKNADNQNFHGIDNKSVSRKHIVITVDKVDAATATDLKARSILTIEDTSKLGSVIDGVKVTGGNKISSTQPEHTIQLGNYPAILRIKWLPIVISLASLTKAQKLNNAQAIRELLEPRDIKISLRYETGTTTHVVAAKRNLPAVLEGLTQGCSIVTDAFIDALSAAVLPNRETQSTAPICYLEQDFDAYWPDAAKYATSAGKEPVPRPPEMLAPLPERSTIFSGYIFVFCTLAQFDSLHAPITSGGGKALLFSKYESQSGASPEDLVVFVKNLAGEKGLGELEDGSEGKGVVVIRLPSTPENEEAVTSFMHRTDLMLGQRSVVQNEFLDAILMNDASSLRRPLPIDDLPSTAQSGPVSQRPGISQESHTITRNLRSRPPSRAQEPPPQESQTLQAHPITQEAEPSAKSSLRRRLRLGQVKSRFKGFDDFESNPVSAAPPPIEEEPADDVDMGDIDSQVHQQSLKRDGDAQVAGSHQGQKRPRGGPDSDDEHVFDALLPAAASMKRRRLANEAVSEGQNTPQLEAKEEKPEPPRLFKKSKAKKDSEEEANFLEAARQRRLKEDEERQIEEETLQEALDGMDLHAIRGNIEIGEMQVRHKPKADLVTASTNDRWDERWNGRKNFKKFRAKHAGPQPLRGHRVIVRLEEAKKKDFGLDDEYWREAEAGAARNAIDDAPIVEDDIDASTVHGVGKRQATLAQTKGKKRPSDDANVSVESKRPVKRGRLAAQSDDGGDSDGSEEELRFKSSRRKRA